MLFKFYKTNYYDSRGTQIKPNDFSDFAAYFLQKVTDCLAVIKLKKEVQTYISTVKDTDGRTSPEILEFLLDLLKDNDNSRNRVSFAAT